MLVLRNLEASRSGWKLRKGRAQPVASNPSPTPLPLSRVSVIRPRPFEDEPAAAVWLDRVCSERETWRSLAEEATALLNRVLHIHRTAAGDAYIADVEPSRAVAIRFGYGTGEEVAEGRWQDARELPDADRRRLIRRDYEALRPQERLAAVLAGRERVGAHEELVLRARGDLDASRPATAALGLHAALELLTSAAGPRIDPADAERVAEAASIARAERGRVLEGSEPDAEQLETAIRFAESALRRRALS